MAARPGARRRRDVRRATREAVASAAGTAAPLREPPSQRQQDPITGALVRRDVLPLLVLHFIAEAPSYGNQLMERIATLTAGVLSVNPNTMYPLLRQLEARGLIKGTWEHPERRTRRFYSLTEAGRAELERLRGEVRPFLRAVRESVERICGELYGPSGSR